MSFNKFICLTITTIKIIPISPPSLLPFFPTPFQVVLVSHRTLAYPDHRLNYFDALDTPDSQYVCFPYQAILQFSVDIK